MKNRKAWVSHLKIAKLTGRIKRHAKFRVLIDDGGKTVKHSREKFCFFRPQQRNIQLKNGAVCTGNLVEIVVKMFLSGPA